MAELGARKDQIIAADSGVRAVKSRLARAQWRLDQRRVNATRAGRVESLYFHQVEQLAPGPISGRTDELAGRSVTALELGTDQCGIH